MKLAPAGCNPRRLQKLAKSGVRLPLFRNCWRMVRKSWGSGGGRQHALVGCKGRTTYLIAWRSLMHSPRPLPPIPAETDRIMRATSPQGHHYLAAADARSESFTDKTFEATILILVLAQPA